MTTIEGPTTTTRRIALAAVIAADGQPVSTGKLPCSPRAAWTYPDNNRTKLLTEAFEAGQPVPVPQTTIWTAYHRLVTESRLLQQGRIGGVV